MKPRCDVAYVVQAVDGSVVKVGVSGNPKGRVYQITQTMPFPMRLVALVSGGKAAERQMKELLAQWKLRGEWFEPRPELNIYLAEQRRANKLLVSVQVNSEFCEQFIKPAIVEYLGGRQPSLTDAGDLVYRFLREGPQALLGRMDKLHTAVKGQISVETLRGFIPLPQDESAPEVLLPPSNAARRDAAPAPVSAQDTAA